MPSGDVHKPPGPDGQSPNRAKKTVSAAGPPRTAKPTFLAVDKQRGKASEEEENEDEIDQQKVDKSDRTGSVDLQILRSEAPMKQSPRKVLQGILKCSDHSQN